MIKELIKALKRKETEVAEMEARIAHELHEELVDLPAFYGFDSLPDFLKAVKKAVAGPTKKRRKARKIVRRKRKQAKRAPVVQAKVKQPAKKVRKKRAVAKKAAPAKIPPVQAAAEDAPLPSAALS